MKTPKRSNEELAVALACKLAELNELFYLATKPRKISAYEYGERALEMITKALTEKDAGVEKALATLHTSLVAAVEGKRKWYETATPMNPDYDDAYNQALDDTLTIINSIFKE